MHAFITDDMVLVSWRINYTSDWYASTLNRLSVLIYWTWLGFIELLIPNWFDYHVI